MESSRQRRRKRETDKCVGEVVEEKAFCVCMVCIALVLYSVHADVCIFCVTTGYLSLSRLLAFVVCSYGSKVLCK